LKRKLNALYTRLALNSGHAPDVRGLGGLGISADLAVHYVARRLAHAAGARSVLPPERRTLALHPSLLLLQRQVEGLHVGGKSALDWYGVRQYVSQQPVLHLYGWKAARLPDWFTERFPAEYHRKRLFDEQPNALHAARSRSAAGHRRCRRRNARCWNC
jgi:hypothetical protein